jgi:hypothetical protein
MCLNQSQPVVSQQYGRQYGHYTSTDLTQHHHAAGTHRPLRHHAMWMEHRQLPGRNFRWTVGCLQVFLCVSGCFWFWNPKTSTFWIRWFFGDTELTFDADPPGSPSTTLLRTLQIFGETASGLWLSTVVAWTEELTLPWLAKGCSCCIFYFKATTSPIPYICTYLFHIHAIIRFCMYASLFLYDYIQ